MIKFREFLAGTILSKSTLIAKNVRSFFEINYLFESKHDRTQHRSYMTRNMTVVSKSTEGIQSPSFEKGWALFISRRKYLYHIEVTVSPSSRRESPSSFRSDSQSIISKRESIVISKWQSIVISKRESIHHFETTVRHHFKTIVLPVINHP